MPSKRTLAKRYKKSKRTHAKIRRSIRRSRKMVRGGSYDGPITKDILYEQSSPDTEEYISGIELAYLDKDFAKLKEVLKRPIGEFTSAREAYKKLITFSDVPEDIKTDLQHRITIGSY